MAAIAFTENALLNVKRGLSASFPDSKSSHLTEALAAACGYRTHAALLEALGAANEVDPEILVLDDEAFLRRLYGLQEDPLAADEDFDWFEWLAYPDKSSVIKTRSGAWYNLTYSTARQRAWRNMMVAAINAGIEQKLFTVRAADNRWPHAADSDGERSTHVFRFSVGDIPALASVRDIGHDELSIHCAFWPTPNAAYWISAYNSEFAAGEAFATGWLERHRGAWLQFNGHPQLNCRKKHLALLAALQIPAKCYGDRGDFFS